MKYFVFYCYLYVNCSGSFYSVGEERLFVCYCLLVIMWFMFREASSSCLG